MELLLYGNVRFAQDVLIGTDRFLFVEKGTPAKYLGIHHVDARVMVKVELQSGMVLVVDPLDIIATEDWIPRKRRFG